MKLGEGINLCNNSGGCPGGDLKRKGKKLIPVRFCNSQNLWTYFHSLHVQATVERIRGDGRGGRERNFPGSLTFFPLKALNEGTEITSPLRFRVVLNSYSLGSIDS